MDLSDEQLVAQAQGGRSQAFEELFMRYKDRAYSIAWQMCSGMNEDAEDVLQEAFLRAFKNIRKFRRESDFYTWFYRILVNTCLDGRRKKRRWERLMRFGPHNSENSKGSEEPLHDFESASSEDPLRMLSKKRFMSDFHRALEALPRQQRAVFQLKVLHGFKIKEVSQIMMMAEGTVKSHLFRAIRSLQRSLRNWDKGIA